MAWQATQQLGTTGRRGSLLRSLQTPAVYSIAPNKANFACFWLENGGALKKQSQFGGRMEHLISPFCDSLGAGMELLNTMTGAVV